MKTYGSLYICLLISVFSLLVNLSKVHGQPDFIGKWEGPFMNDFKAIVNFTTNDHDQIEGNIRMFAGNNLIQDDRIIRIKSSGDTLSFYIPDKETSFEGKCNSQMTELSGNFIFPDGSKHAILLNKVMDETNALEEFRRLKNERFNAGELISDLEFLYSGLKEHHPRLYATTSRESMEVLVEEMKRNIDTSLTLEEFYLVTTKLTDAVHCSHTGIGLPVAYQNLAHRYGNYFPLRLFFSDGKAFYVAGYEGNDELIFPGQEILGINDMPVNQIIEQTFYFIPSEGRNTTTKYNKLNKRFNELYYFLDDRDEFTVQFKSGDSIQNVIISASNYDSIYPFFDVDDTKLTFIYRDDMDAAVLRVPTFAVQDMDHYFYRLDSIFMDLKATKTQNLVLDLRDNNGGHPIFAAQLFSYLTSRDFVYFRRNDEIKEFEPLYNTMPPNKLNYRGNIYVLINGGCLSTTGHLISLLKFNTNAVFIGEEPGSTYRCNDFSIQFTLPNTGLELNVPRTTFETAVTGFGADEAFGVDYVVKVGVDDIIKGEDAINEIAKIIRNE